MIDFDEGKFAEQFDKQKALFDMGVKILDDPLVQEALKQFAKGVMVSVGVAVVKHAFFQYRKYKQTKLGTVDEVMQEMFGSN